MYCVVLCIYLMSVSPTVAFIFMITSHVLLHPYTYIYIFIFFYFQNCSYYWGFAAFVSYFVNHPLYTVASKISTCIVYTKGH